MSANSSFIFQVRPGLSTISSLASIRSSRAFWTTAWRARSLAMRRQWKWIVSCSIPLAWLLSLRIEASSCLDPLLLLLVSVAHCFSSVAVER